MTTFDYTNQGRRPSVAQIISDWKKADKPTEFEVTYGETYAHFQHAPSWGQEWQADGNGCRGVERDKVQAKLNLIARTRRCPRCKRIITEEDCPHCEYLRDNGVQP